MFGRIRPRLTYANVMASMAMFIVLGGGAYAATVLPRNSVGTKQLKKAAVTGAKIKAGAVTGTKVRDGSLLATDFAAGQLPAGSTGPAGPAGPKGDKGDPGTPGTAGADGADGTNGTNGTNGSNAFGKLRFARNFNNCTVAEATQGSCTATCPDSMKPVGGGGVGEGTHDEQILVNGSRPNPATGVPTGWTAFFDNNADLNASTNHNVTTYVICADATDTAAVSVSG